MFFGGWLGWFWRFSSDLRVGLGDSAGGIEAGLYKGLIYGPALGLVTLSGDQP